MGWWDGTRAGGRGAPQRQSLDGGDAWAGGSALLTLCCSFFVGGWPVVSPPRWGLVCRGRASPSRGRLGYITAAPHPASLPPSHSPSPHPSAPADTNRDTRAPRVVPYAHSTCAPSWCLDLDAAQQRPRPTLLHRFPGGGVQPRPCALASLDGKHHAVPAPQSRSTASATAVQQPSPLRGVQRVPVRSAPMPKRTPPRASGAPRPAPPCGGPPRGAGLPAGERARARQILT